MQRSTQLEDQELMKLCRQGHAEGFTELYRRYNKAVFNTILRLITDFAQAQDLLQEAFIALYQEIMKGRDIQHFAHFSRRVAANKAISFLRARKHVLVFEDSRDNIVEDEAEDEDLFEMKVEGVKKPLKRCPRGSELS
ncbi:RNA polymerase sigma factor [Niabella hibiscisoli]|uniref:RNA polymerase sigma factor n=1 Tax=Niabella hibiscisoli TaxID=1825928 RepID=UPI001F108282|nr:sigma-70 family RNA polymerase sigma factor [Niabella hibiscisoli]MCH5718591.1 sigma-70 family RNA polymerase sigma factor [Niabella hibiscisoli]